MKTGKLTVIALNMLMVATAIMSSLLFGILGTGRQPQGPGGFSLPDFTLYIYPAGKLWLNGSNPYDGFFPYPPNSSLFCILLSLADLETSKMIYQVLNLSCMTGLVYLCLRLYRLADRANEVSPWDFKSSLLISILVGNVFVFNTLWIGQTSLFITTMLLASYYHHIRSHEVRSGIFLALALNKPQLVFTFLLWLLLEKKWKTLAVAAAMTVILGIVPIWQRGPMTTVLDWINLLIQYVRVVNQDCFWNLFGLQPLLTDLGIRIDSIAVFASSALIVILIHRYRPNHPSLKLYGILTMVGLLLGQASQYDLVVILPAAAYYMSRIPNQDFKRIVLLLLTFALFNFPRQHLLLSEYRILHHHRELLLLLLLCFLLFLPERHPTGGRPVHGPGKSQRRFNPMTIIRAVFRRGHGCARCCFMQRKRLQHLKRRGGTAQFDRNDVGFPGRSGKGMATALLGAAFFAGVVALCSASAQELSITPSRPAGIYALGEQASWNLRLRESSPPASSQIQYLMKRNGLAVHREGLLSLENGSATLAATLNEPGTLLVELRGARSSGTTPALAGAAFGPERISPSEACPSDFDPFWRDKLLELRNVQDNTLIESADSGNPAVHYAKLQINHLRGTRIYGQLAKPKRTGPFPALLILQWAGLYPLQREWVVSHAEAGWLSLNIMAHNLPFDRPQHYYDELDRTTLANYPALGNDNRETSIFLRMYLSGYRAAEYLIKHPDWDGRTLIVVGSSQGAMQAIATAALHPRVTAGLVNTPAGCDLNGPVAGRAPGWPAWYWQTRGKDPERVRHTGRYFDAVNFASRIKAPFLVVMGLVDTTCPATGVFAMVNQLRGPKEVVVNAQGGHLGFHETYYRRSTAWLSAFAKTGRPPE